MGKKGGIQKKKKKVPELKQERKIHKNNQENKDDGSK